MFTQPRDLNNKTKPTHKSTAPTVTEQIILSPLVSKNNETMKIDVMLMHDQNLRKKLLYNISVRLQMTKHQGMIQDQMIIQIDTVVEVRLVIIVRYIIILNIDNDLHLELVIIMIDILLPHTTLDHVMISIKEILAHTGHHTGLLIDHPTDQ